MKSRNAFLFDIKILYKSYSKPGKASIALKIAKNRKWLPITTNSKRFITILDVFSWIYGDGHLHKDGYILLSGQRCDLEKIAAKIKTDLKLDSCIVWDPHRGKNKTKTNKETCRLCIKNGCRPFGRLLMALGAPSGNKVLSEFYIPEWIMKSNPIIKKRFLEVLFSNEITVRKINERGHLPKFEIRMNKSPELVNNGLYFMGQISKLLKDIGIESWKPKANNRQDNKNKTLSLIVAGDLINIYKFYKTFNLRYSFKKQKSLEKIGRVAENKLKNHLQNIKNYKSAMKLKKSGIGRRRGSVILGLNTHLIDGWFRRDNKPIFFEKEREIKNLLNGG